MRSDFDDEDLVSQLTGGDEPPSLERSSSSRRRSQSPLRLTGGAVSTGTRSPDRTTGMRSALSSSLPRLTQSPVGSNIQLLPLAIPPTAVVSPQQARINNAYAELKRILNVGKIKWSVLQEESNDVIQKRLKLLETAQDKLNDLIPKLDDVEGPESIRWAEQTNVALDLLAVEVDKVDRTIERRRRAGEQDDTDDDDDETGEGNDDGDDTDNDEDGEETDDERDKIVPTTLSALFVPPARDRIQFAAAVPVVSPYIAETYMDEELDRIRMTDYTESKDLQELKQFADGLLNLISNLTDYRILISSVTGDRTLRPLHDEIKEYNKNRPMDEQKPHPFPNAGGVLSYVKLLPRSEPKLLTPITEWIQVYNYLIREVIHKLLISEYGQFEKKMKKMFDKVQDADELQSVQEHEIKMNAYFDQQFEWLNDHRANLNLHSTSRETQRTVSLDYYTPSSNALEGVKYNLARRMEMAGPAPVLPDDVWNRVDMEIKLAGQRRKEAKFQPFEKNYGCDNEFVKQLIIHYLRAAETNSVKNIPSTEWDRLSWDVDPIDIKGRLRTMLNPLACVMADWIEEQLSTKLKIQMHDAMVTSGLLWSTPQRDAWMSKHRILETTNYKSLIQDQVATLQGKLLELDPSRPNLVYYSIKELVALVEGFIKSEENNRKDLKKAIVQDDTIRQVRLRLIGEGASADKPLDLTEEGERFETPEEEEQDMRALDDEAEDIEGSWDGSDEDDDNDDDDLVNDSKLVLDDLESAMPEFKYPLKFDQGRKANYNKNTKAKREAHKAKIKALQAKLREDKKRLQEEKKRMRDEAKEAKKEAIEVKKKNQRSPSPVVVSSASSSPLSSSSKKKSSPSSSSKKSSSSPSSSKKGSGKGGKRKSGGGATSEGEKLLKQREKEKYAQRLQGRTATTEWKNKINDQLIDMLQWELEDQKWNKRWLTRGDGKRLLTYMNRLAEPNDVIAARDTMNKYIELIQTELSSEQIANANVQKKVPKAKIKHIINTMMQFQLNSL